MSEVAIGEAFDGALRTMDDYVTEVKETVDTVFTDLLEVVKDNTWKVLYDVASNLEKTYNEEVLQKIKKQIDDWAQGDGSYVSLVTRFKMGDEAVNDAKAKQDDLVESIKNISDSSKISDMNPNFLNSKFDLDSVKNKLQEISNNASKLNEIVGARSNELNKLYEENVAVGTLVNVGKTYGESIASFVSKVTEKISTVLSEQIDNIGNAQTAAVEEANKSADAFNQSIDDTLNNIHSFLNGLFG